MMKLTKYVFGLFLLCNLLISCSQDAITEDDALFLIEDVFGTDDYETPPDETQTGG